MIASDAYAEVALVPFSTGSNEIMSSDGVNQYFMYLQQNVVHGADLSAVAPEAERRHRQVLQQVVEIYE